MLLLIAHLVPLVFGRSTFSPLLVSPIPKDAGKQWCLVQSARSVVTVALEQPALPDAAGALQPSAVPEWLNATESETGRNSRYTEAQHLYDLSASWVAQLAFKLCVHWQGIVLLFTLGFAVIFPLLHWTFEHRQSERAMFNYSDSEAGNSKGVVNMLKHIRIDRSGGLDKVRSLIDVDRPKPRRTIKVFAHMLSITFNVFMLVQQDITLLSGAADYYNGTPHDALPATLKRYLEFTGNTSLISVRHAACVALAELLGLGAMVIWIIYRFSVFRFCRKSYEAKFDAFLGLHQVFESVHLLGGFSALRLVSFVHPALVMRQFQWDMARPFLRGDGTSAKYVLQFVYFVATRSVAVVLSVLAFGVKLAFTSVQVHMPLVGEHWFKTFFWRWSVVIMLLEQTLGAVALEHVMWWRVMLVLAEGGDRQITLEKIQIMHVYLSKIVQSIYEEYWCKGKHLQFFVLMLTFDHIDLQHLMIDEGRSPLPQEPSTDDIPPPA